MPLLENAVRVLAVLGIGLGVVGVCRHRSAAFRHRVLSTAMICALLMPLVSAIAPTWQWWVPDASVGTFISDLSTGGEPSPEPPLSNSGVVGISRPATDLSWLPLGIWGIGLIVCLAVMSAGLLRLRQIASGARVIDDETWKRLSSEIAGSYGLSRPALLLESDEVSTVMTWGAATPRVVVPSGARQWSRDRVRSVLAHEFAHVNRRDWPTQLAASVLRAFNWFNPLVWVVYRRLREESERASDDLVLGLGIDGPEYAKHLVDLLRASRDRRSLPALAFTRGQPSAIERRVSAMLNSTSNRQAVSPRSALTIASLFLVVGLAAGGCGPSVRATSIQAADPAMAVLSGYVEDRTFALIPGAEITVQDLADDSESGSERVRISNEEGRFRFEGLRPGDYRLTARLPGFSLQERTIRLEAGRELETVLRLEIGGVATQLEVRATRLTPTESPTEQATAVTEPLRLGGNLVPGRLINRVEPDYPRELREAGVGGTVSLEATIGADGTLQDVIAFAGPPLLRRSAVEAVRQWSYEPFQLNGEATDVPTTIVVDFTLADD